MNNTQQTFCSLCISKIANNFKILAIHPCLYFFADFLGFSEPSSFPTDTSTSVNNRKLLPLTTNSGMKQSDPFVQTPAVHSVTLFKKPEINPLLDLTNPVTVHTFYEKR